MRNREHPEAYLETNHLIPEASSLLARESSPGTKSQAEDRHSRRGAAAN